MARTDSLVHQPPKNGRLPTLTVSMGREARGDLVRNPEGQRRHGASMGEHPRNTMLAASLSCTRPRTPLRAPFIEVSVLQAR